MEGLGKRNSRSISKRRLRTRKGFRGGRRIAVLLTIAFAMPLWPTPAFASHTATCRADAPTLPGETMTWRALPAGGSGNYSYAWSGTDGLAGTSSVVTKTYASAGFKVGRLSVTDQQSGDVATTECGMNVVPNPLPQPATVDPVIWVPRGTIDPATILPQLERVMRSIRAEYYHMYGKTFVLNPIRIVRSPRSEFDICGGDCTDQGEADTLRAAAWNESTAEVSVVPYARSVLVMMWGAGGVAGSYSWDYPLAAVGDWTFAGIVGLRVPTLEAGYDVGTWVLDGLDEYRRPIACALAHELNHSIGWDDPHDFCLGSPPNDYERQVVSRSPWLTVTPSDITRPSVSFQASAGLSSIGGTTTLAVNASDAGGIDAVVLLVDGVYVDIDAIAPYSFAVDTTRLGFGTRTFTAIAYDVAGNTSESSRDWVVSNVVAGSACSGQFPVGVFHACIYDGVGTTGPYLGTLLDSPSWRSDNAAHAINHGFSSGVAFGQTDTFTGVWRGQFDFPEGNYRFRFDTDDGLRVRVNGALIIDAWFDQVGYYEAILALSGPASLEIQWYQNVGADRLRFVWGPTLNPPPGQFTVSVDVDGSGGVTSSPGGINCGIATDCYQSYPIGQIVTLTPTPRPGASFLGWSGDADCSDGVIVANANKKCIATFDAAARRSAAVDFDGDGDTDIAVFRPSSGDWYVAGGNPVARTWGNSTDMPAVGDYDGDGKADMTVYRPSSGVWYVNRSSGGITTMNWGLSTDVPVAADYDGDGRTDIAVYRPSSGTWYVNRSSGGFTTTTWGIATDLPVPGDYDGDGKIDIAVYRPSSGAWYVNRSSGGFTTTTWGLATDVPVAGDYDGDGRADIAVYRASSGVWYVNRSSGGFTTTNWGLSTDVPVILRPGDRAAPTVSWSAPVHDGERFDVASGAVTLVASAQDNVGVSQVRFFRWDHPLQMWIDLGTDSAAPWQVTIDVATLNPEWNEVHTQAFDAAGNASSSPYIWLYKTM